MAEAHDEFVDQQVDRGTKPRRKKRTSAAEKLLNTLPLTEMQRKARLIFNDKISAGPGQNWKELAPRPECRALIDFPLLSNSYDGFGGMTLIAPAEEVQEVAVYHREVKGKVKCVIIWATNGQLMAVGV